MENQADNPEQNAVKKSLDPLTVELVRARKAAGWTQNELHQKTGISRDAIKGYESGRNLPGSRELRVLCEALGVSANRVLWGRDSFQAASGPVKGILIDPAMDQARQGLNMFILVGLLTQEERDAIFTLIEPIIVGRKGGREEIRKAFATAGVIAQDFQAEVLRVAEGVMRDSLTPERVAAVEARVAAEIKKKPGK